MQFPKNFTSRRVIRSGLIIMAVFVLIIATLPAIAGRTSFRQYFVERLLSNPNLEASVGSASFGWFSSTKLNEVHIKDAADTVRIDIDRWELRRSLPHIIATAPHVGRMEVHRPQVELTLSEISKPFEKKKSSESTYVAHLQDAQLLLRTEPGAEPVIDVDDVNLTVHMQQNGPTRQIMIEPALILNRQPATPELCDRGLHLIAPMLAAATQVDGEISVELEEFVVPLRTKSESDGDNTAQTRIRGAVTLHELRSELTNPILRQAIQMTAQRLGKSPPKIIQVLEDTRVDFHVGDEGVYYEGMAFVLPEVSEKMIVKTSGWTGFDRRLDLKVDVGLPSDLVADVPLLAQLSQQSFEFRIGGTIDNPKFNFKDGRDLLDEIAGRLDPDSDPQKVKPLGRAITDLVGGIATQTDKDGDGKKDVEVIKTTTGILNIIRAVREEADRSDKQKKESADDAKPEKKRKSED